MLIYLTFLKKEWIEVLQCKKALLSLIICLTIPFTINLIAKNPIIPLDIIAPLYIVMSAMVVAELIKASLIEEIALSTLDNLFIAPFKKEYLIIYKTTIPIIIAFVVAVLGLILSDIAALLIPSFSHFMKTTTFFNVVTAFITACCCGWFNFYLILKTRNTEAAFFTMALGGFAVFLGAIALVANMYSITIIVITGLLLLLFLYVICGVLLTSPQPVKRKSARQWFCFFKEQNLTFCSAIIVKDFATIRTAHILEATLYIAIIFTVKNEFAFYAMLFLLSTFGTRKLLYQNIVEEKLNKTGDILRLKQSDLGIFMVKSIVPTVLSLILSMVAIAVSIPSVGNVYFALLMVLISPICAYPIALTVHRPKEISIGNLLLSAVLLAVYFIGFLLAFV